MKKIAAKFLLASSILGCLSIQSALAVDNLFPGSLFPDDKSKPMFNDFNVDTPATISSKSKDPEVAKKELKEVISRDDEQMRREMQKVASWLQEYCMRNLNRFPGVYGSSGTIGRAAEVQLTELVGPNPYANTSGYINNRELNGLSPGLSYYYNSDGTPAADSPMANDEWTAELTADNAHRIQLQMDQNASSGEIDQFKNSPPDSMNATPGTICAAGNSQGYLYVWAAGSDGKPLKDYNGKPYIISAQTGTNVNDQGQEAGY